MTVKVHILIRVAAGRIWKASEDIAEIEGVQSASVVTGPYDIIAIAEIPSTEDMRNLLNNLHDVDGVIRTETCVNF